MSHNLLKVYVFARIQENINRNISRKGFNSLSKRVSNVKADTAIRQLTHQLLDRCACCGRRIPVSGPEGKKYGPKCSNGNCTCK